MFAGVENTRKARQKILPRSSGKKLEKNWGGSQGDHRPQETELSITYPRATRARIGRFRV